jgi:YbbR domain-containing protein
MLKNKRFTLVLAFIIAVALWAYVLGEVDPERSITIRDIPITYTNEAALEDAGLVITSVDYDNVDASFSAKRSIANKISEEDFHAIANLSGLTWGDNVVELSITKPSSITLDSVSPQYITITTDNYVAVEKEIDIEFSNQIENKEPMITQLSSDTITVSGAESVVSKVDRVVAEVDASRITEESNAISVALKALDADGAEVAEANLSESNVTVTAVMMNTKTVKLSVPIKGQDSGSITRDVDVPEEVTIKGSSDLLEWIDSVECKEIDLSEVYVDTTIILEPVLPYGVQLASASMNPEMQVIVYNASEVSFEFDETDITVTGVSEYTTVTIEDVEILVTAKGTFSAIGSLTKKDLVITADVTGLYSGSHTVELKITSKVPGVDIAQAEPSSVVIKLEM